MYMYTYINDICRYIYNTYNIVLKISMWAYNLIVNNIARSKYIFVENNKIEILFSNYLTVFS